MGDAEPELAPGAARPSDAPAAAEAADPAGPPAPAEEEPPDRRSQPSGALATADVPLCSGGGGLRAAEGPATAESGSGGVAPVSVASGPEPRAAEPAAAPADRATEGSGGLAAGSEEGEVPVSVEAEVADGTSTVWTKRISGSTQLRSLVQRWAEAHGVPCEAVGLEDATGQLIDLALSLAELAKSTSPPMHLRAIPLDDAFAELDPASAPAAVLAGPPAPASPVDGADAPKRRRSRASVPEASEAPAAKVPRKSGNAGEEVRKPAAALLGRARSTAERYPDWDGSDVPAGEVPIRFLPDNPKKPGTAGWERYEAYKGASTCNQALALGAAKGDLKHDWMKGYFKRV